MAERKTRNEQAKAAADTSGDDQATTKAADDGDTGQTAAEPAKGEQAKPKATGSVMSTAAAPIEAPERTNQRTPHLGDPGTSTNPLSASAALRSVPGSDHRRLVDEDDNDVALESLFDFPKPGSPSTLATVPSRVYEEFNYPNTTTRARQLLYPAGALVPVFEARRVLDTFKHADESELPKP